MRRANNEHLNRESYFLVAHSVWDNYKNLGFQYKGNLFKKTISSIFYLDPRKARILDKFDGLIYHLIENVKHLKKFRNYAVARDSHNIN